MDKYENRDVVVKALVGSHNYNLNTANSDEDYKYFVAPSFSDLYFGKMFSTAKQTDTVDFDVHDVRQLLNLLWKSNINFMEVLFSKKLEYHPDLDWLFLFPENYASMNLPAFWNATMGMHKQKMSELFKGTEKTKVLVDTYGYDTKQACHALRCLMVLERYTKTKSMEESLWFEDDSYHFSVLMGVKTNNVSLGTFENIVKAYLPRVEQYKEWYMNQNPNTDLKSNAECLMFDFVKDHLK